MPLTYSEHTRPPSNLGVWGAGIQASALKGLQDPVAGNIPACLAAAVRLRNPICVQLVDRWEDAGGGPLCISGTRCRGPPIVLLVRDPAREQKLTQLCDVLLTTTDQTLRRCMICHWVCSLLHLQREQQHGSSTQRWWWASTATLSQCVLACDTLLYLYL